MELLLFTIPLLLISTVYGQNNTGIKLNKQSAVAKTGDTFSVNCKLTEETPGYNANPDYKWLDTNGQPILASDSSTNRKVIRKTPAGHLLVINAVMERDAGIYKCEVEAAQSVYTADFKLEVQATVQFTNCPAKQNGLMGGSVTIRCSASSSNAVVWFEKDGTQINYDSSERYRSTVEGMAITGLNDKDAGIYKYYVIANDETKYTNISLTVVVAPRILTPILEGVAVGGEKHTLYCKADGKPLPTIYWYKQGSTNPLETTDRITVSTKVENGHIQGILEFDPVMKEDDTIYTCKAVGIKLNEKDDTPLENSTSSRMIVHIKPKVEEMTAVEKFESQAAELICVARGDPKPSAVWQKVGTDIQYSSGSNSDGEITVTEKSLDDPSNPGTEIKLQFASVKSSNSGSYKCVALNKAGEAENTVSLRVRYKPTFDDQETGPFYTWLGFNDGFIPCTAHGDPAPTFRWYKMVEGGDPVEINSADPDYTVNREEDVDNEFKVTSKLLVTYTGSNKGVFTSYKCVAKNKVGETSQELAIQEGLKPASPLVSEEKIYANKIILEISDQPVQGPPVKQYKISYMPVTTDSPANSITIIRPKETRPFTDDKSGNPKTLVEIEPLEARTRYEFTVIAINDVGEGEERITTLQTKALSKPGEITILNEANSAKSTSITVLWQEPNDGGSPILRYIVTCKEVAVKSNNATLNSKQGYEFLNPIRDVETAEVTATSYTLKKAIRPGQYYMVTVKALNSVGPGTPGQKIIRTPEDPLAAIDGAPRLVSVSTTVTLFGCLAALSACLKSFV